MKKQTIGIIEIVIASLLFGFIPVLVRWGNTLGGVLIIVGFLMTTRSPVIMES